MDSHGFRRSQVFLPGFDNLYRAVETLQGKAAMAAMEF